MEGRGVIDPHSPITKHAMREHAARLAADGVEQLYATAAGVLTRAEFSELWKRAIAEAKAAGDGRVFGRIMDAVAREVEERD